MTPPDAVLTSDARPRRGPVLVGLLLTMGLAAVDVTIVSTVVPQIVDSVGGFSSYGWLFSIYLLTQTVTIPVYGKLADVRGRKPVLVVGVLVFLAGSVLCSAAWSMAALIAFRAVQGLGAGCIQATVQTLAGDLYEVHERGRVQGWLSSVWAVCSIGGPALGGLLAHWVSWRAVFLVNLPVGAVALVLVVRHLRDRPPAGTPPPPDRAGSVLTLLSAGLLVLALLQGGVGWAWLSPPGLACLVGVVLFTALTVLVERRAADPVVPGWVWRQRVLAGANLGYLALGLLVIGPTTVLAVYGQTVLGYGPFAAAAGLTAMSVSWPVASALAARLYLRIGFRDTALLGAATALAGALVFLAAPAGGVGLVASSLLYGAGCGLVSTPLVVGIQSAVPTDRRGVATGSLMFCRFLGESLGAAVFGAVVNGTLQARLSGAPPELAPALPAGVDGVAPALTGSSAPADVQDYLRAAMEAAVGHLYEGLAVVAVLAAAVLLIAPRRFPAAGGAVGQPADDVAAVE